MRKIWEEKTNQKLISGGALFIGISNNQQVTLINGVIRRNAFKNLAQKK